MRWRGGPRVSDAYRTVLYDEEGREVFLPGYRVDALIDAAIRYVEHRREEPFFLFLSFLEPHHQNKRDEYPAPDGYAERYHGAWTPPDLACLPAWDGSGLVVGTAQRDLGGYWGMVRRLDEALGRLLDALKSLGLGVCRIWQTDSLMRKYHDKKPGDSEKNQKHPTGCQACALPGSRRTPSPMRPGHR